MKEFGVSIGIEVIPWYTFVLALISTIGGAGLIRIQGWAGNLTIAISAILIAYNMFNLPGSLIAIVMHAAMLRFMLDHKTRFILSSPYQAIIKSTPLVKSEMASWIEFVFALFLMGISTLVWMVLN